jgi:hypothetical protein
MALRKGIERLPADDRETLRLYFFEEHKQSDIAKVFDQPHAGVAPAAHGPRRAAPRRARHLTLIAAFIDATAKGHRLAGGAFQRLAPPVARWGQDWVFTTAARQFAAAALGG